MIICKECENRFGMKWKWLKAERFDREVECPYCDAIIDFSLNKRVNRVRLLFKTLSWVFHVVIVVTAVNLPFWLFPSSFLQRLQFFCYCVL